MAITPVERERIADSKLKIRSVAKSLKHVSPDKIHDFQEIQDCLEQAEENLDEALQQKPGAKGKE